MSRKRKRVQGVVCRCRHSLAIHTVRGTAPACAVCPCQRFARLIEKTTEPDITKNRHKGNVHSVDANKVTKKERDRATCLAFIRDCGWRGATAEEVSIGTGMHYTTVSARMSELKELGSVREAGSRLTTRGAPAGVVRSIEVEDKLMYGTLPLEMSAT